MGVTHIQGGLLVGTITCCLQCHPLPPSHPLALPLLQDGFTALHRSCVTGNARIIQYLISKGATVNIEDSVSVVAGERGLE